MIETRVEQFIQDPQAEGFNALALDVFRWQCEHSETLRRLCDRRGRSPDEIEDWSEVPTVPARGFKTTDLAFLPPEVVFRSSGTTQPERSVHGHAHLALYRTVIEHTFPLACLTTPPPVPMLSLIPSSQSLPDSSLSFMIDFVLERFANSDSVTALGAHGVQFTTARSWLGTAQRHGRAAVVLATGLALKQLLDAFERRDLRFRLPAGSVLFETGGTKGRIQEIPRDELLRAVRYRLGLEATQLVREYGMTELTSHFYTDALHGGDPDVFVPPPWTRVRVLDPRTLDPVEPGQEGLLAIFDLANLSSAVHILTEDLGREVSAGFSLTGRAQGAELRGCSLAAEELAGS